MDRWEQRQRDLKKAAKSLDNFQPYTKKRRTEEYTDQSTRASEPQNFQQDCQNGEDWIRTMMKIWKSIY